MTTETVEKENEKIRSCIKLLDKTIISFSIINLDMVQLLWRLTKISLENFEVLAILTMAMSLVK